MRLYELPDNVIALEEVNEDLDALDHSQIIQVVKAIIKTARSPQPKPGGYGTPLSGNLSGFNKIKLKKAGIRVVYRYLRTVDGMMIIVIGVRADSEVYTMAEERIKKHSEIFENN